MWLYNGKPFTSEDIKDYVGFVYLITNLNSSRKYIGKKGFYKVKAYQKNKKRRRKKVESDWQDYFGSCQALVEDVKKQGEGDFRREIIRLCKSKGEMNYFELEEQVLNKVLWNDDFYNDYIGTRVHRKHIAHVERLLSDS